MIGNINPPMEIDYKLTAEDIVQSFLFMNSRSVSLRKRRRSAWIKMIVACLIIAIAFAVARELVLAICAGVICIATIFFYPKYFKNHYNKYYQKAVAENLKGE